MTIIHLKELLPEHVLKEFFGKHEVHAKLPLQYPDASVLLDTCSLNAVDAYRHTFRGSVLRDYATTYTTIKSAPAQRHVDVARQRGIVVWPIQSAEACMVAAYAMLKCKEIYDSQSA